MSTTDDLRAIRKHLAAGGLAGQMRRLVDVLIAERNDAPAKPADDEGADEPRCLDVFAVGGQDALSCERFAGHRGMHWANDLNLQWEPDPAHPSTAAEVAPGRAQDASGSGNDTCVVCEPHRGVQSLGDDLREFAVELAGATWTPFAAASVAEGLAARADALTTERDRLAADIAIMRDADLTATDVQRRRAETAEGERDELREMVERMKTATTPLQIEREEPEDDQRVQAWYAIWNHPAIAGHWTDEGTAIEIVFRRLADLTQAEAAVARVRALVHDTSARVGALMFTPMTRARQYVTGVTLDDLRAALDGEGA